MDGLAAMPRGFAPIRWLASLVLGVGAVIVCIGLVAISALVLVVTAPAGLLRRLRSRGARLRH